uniref:DIX domain-containing protein n=1 Tax=Panagrolaimus sp. JU765 TaxID=591449 RepID=A0AC34RCC2_9BILA
MDIQQDTLQKIDKLQLHETENESLLNGHHVVASSSTANGGHLSDIDGKSEVSEKSQKSTQRTNGSGSGVGSSTTKVCYHIDDEPTPYVTHVPVPPDQITLLDFKQMLNKTNYKFYCKSNDPEVGGEVKAEIRDDTQRLFRGSNGQFELFLLTTDGSNNSDGASSGFSKNIRQMVPGPAPSSYPFNMPHVRHFPGFDHGWFTI